MSNDINSTLGERGTRYGDFEGQAAIAQDLKAVMQQSGGWTRLDDDQREALDMMANKVARALNGDPTYRDNWHDLVGYFKLVDDRMARDEQRNCPEPEETTKPYRSVIATDEGFIPAF